ncbi:arsenate reductase (glutaredoxin) [Pacificoceanicola onchidii]|uniref:arsenate reductase (glutaredoxin) n=1 Tax=Pacificoceanicola onchidii TaxID=2562685 RepID=UPI0010A37EAB|nr:arsenate reductase (glutaredoxin) [Pacificoceanicola onchidii]
MELILWHNPRCTKSRQTLALLEERGVTLRIRKYLEDAPSLAEIEAAQAALGVSAIEMMRPKEAVFKEMGLSKADDDATLRAAMAEQPKLIERPILFAGDRAAIGRPPEQVLSLL